MPIVNCRYRFPESDGPSRLEMPDEVARRFAGGEWLLLGDRSELELFVAGVTPMAPGEWRRLLETGGLLPGSAGGDQITSGRDAVRRFLAIAVGMGGRRRLEALHAAYARASENTHVGPLLHRLFQRGILLHEKARQETDFFRFAVERETVFRELTEKIIGPLHGARVLCLGAGAALEATMDALFRAGARRFVLVGAPEEADSGLLDRFAASFHSPEALRSLVGECDILLAYPGGGAHLDESLMRTLLRRASSAPLVVLDAAGSGLDTRALRRSDSIYLYYPEDLDTIIHGNRLDQEAAAAEVAALVADQVERFYEWLKSEERFQFAGIIGATPAMQRLFELISRITRNDITVLIDGESGTGKELVARAIHRLSSRAERPFKVLNCGAIPENLLESELFGHVRGAFTGAVASKRGLFEAADRGTLFLDEVAELPVHLQVKLLRFLQEGEIRPVGSNDTVQVDVRVIAATNKDLAAMVETGAFRSDLYYRLNVIQLTLPPLRERGEDIPLLARHFLKRHGERLRKEVTGFAPEALALLRRYDWPGNIRELENAIERAVALAYSSAIAPFDLPPSIREAAGSSPSGAEAAPGGAEAAPPVSLREMEKRHILATLDACGWNHEQAAKRLEIGRTTLWRKLKEYGVQEER